MERKFLQSFKDLLVNISTVYVLVKSGKKPFEERFVDED